MLYYTYIPSRSVGEILKGKLVFFWNLRNSFYYYLYLKGIDAIFSVSDKTRTSMMKIDGVFTVLDEAPGKLANAILLFTKGMYFSISFVLVEFSTIKFKSGLYSTQQQNMIFCKIYQWGWKSRLSNSLGLITLYAG